MKDTLYFTKAQLQAELERCEFCSEKPCLEACPAHCCPADFIMAARQGRPSDFRRSALEIMRANPLGHVCGIVCPDTLCMDACTRKTFDRPVQIPKIQATVMQRARELGVFNHDDIIKEKPKAIGKKIAIIGAGPAGLGAAAYLARLGYGIEIFEAGKIAGGACLQIPPERLPRDVIQADVEFVLSLGDVKLSLKKNIKRPDSLLKNGFDAVLVCVGQPEITELDVQGEALAVSSMQYLSEPKKFKGKKKVAILGGGAVAADCAVTARKNGAEAVEMFVRRTLAEMRLTDFERRMLLEHKIDISTRTRPLGLEGKKGGKLTLITTKVEPVKGKLQDIPRTRIKRPGFDLVVLAIGNVWNGNKHAHPAISYAGDCVEGGSTVVEAVAGGKNAAARIDQRLREISADEKKFIKKAALPGSRSKLKSRMMLSAVGMRPVNLETDFFGIPISSPFIISAAPATDGLEQVKQAFDAGWPGVVMKTAFDHVPIHIPGEYMFTFGGSLTHGNCDNVSGHPLDRVCREILELRRLYPERLTMASTGGPVTGNDESDKKIWQSNTRKLEQAGAMGVEYSLSCPQGGDGTEGDIVSQNAALSAKIIDWVMQVSDPGIPKLFKLSAAVTSIKPILSAIREVYQRYPDKKAGVTLANSFPVMGFRPRKKGNEKESRWEEGVVVGMSGEGVIPISYLTLANVSHLGVEVSGNGGVMNYLAAANFLALGAKTVQVCTVVTKYGVGIIKELESGLSHLLNKKGLSSVKELIGIALPKPVTPFGELSAEKMISAAIPELCQHCGNCTRCPYLAIRLNREKNPQTEASRCVGCSICVQQCFSGALFMRERTKEEQEALSE